MIHSRWRLSETAGEGMGPVGSAARWRIATLERSLCGPIGESLEEVFVSHDVTEEIVREQVVSQVVTGR